MHEHVLPTTLRLDKAIAFGGVEPLHGTFSHDFSPIKGPALTRPRVRNKPASHVRWHGLDYQGAPPRFLQILTAARCRFPARSASKLAVGLPARIVGPATATWHRRRIAPRRAVSAPCPG